MHDEFDFTDLAPAEVPVKVGEHRYFLCEAGEDEAVRWKNEGAKRARMVDGKVVGVNNVADLPALLVSLCLYRADDSGALRRLPDGRPDPKYRVPVSLVLTWRAKIVRRLFAKARDISELGDEETPEFLRNRIAEDQAKLKGLLNGTLEDSAKNAPGATTDTSV